MLLSQTDVVFSHYRRTCPIPNHAENAATAHCSEARNVLQPRHFSLNFDALGWLLPKHIAVAHGEC